MKFTVLERYGRPPRDTFSEVFLTWDDWNDYSFYTLFGIYYVDSKGKSHDLGAVKIGFYGQEEAQRSLRKGQFFVDSIGSEHFSVGLDDEYYVKLNQLGPEVRDAILFGLNDIARNLDLLEKVELEEVFKVSFLRGISITTIEGQFSRLAIGAARLTPYHFSFTTPSVSGVNPITLTFDVEPDSNPPTNIHVLIGRNGVGKTFLVNSMIDALTKKDDAADLGIFQATDEETEKLFANLICVTFSAFDEFDHPPEKKDKSLDLQYSYIGLKTIQGDGSASEIIDPSTIPVEFLKSIKVCKTISRSKRWKEAISALDTDPMFRSSNVSELIDLKSEIALSKKAAQLFKKLSTGHKLILLTITRLVEKLEERSLVLIDEPESHLHPPLLSSFMLALSGLLIDRNAVSIIATHSPVILQEVPGSCVWKLRRSGTEAVAERLQIEPYGENVGILTQEVFGLEVTESGFHRNLKALVAQYRSYEAALNAVNDQLGMEARAILRGLFHDKMKRNAGNR